MSTILTLSERKMLAPIGIGFLVFGIVTNIFVNRQLKAGLTENIVAELQSDGDTIQLFFEDTKKSVSSLLDHLSGVFFDLDHSPEELQSQLNLLAATGTVDSVDIFSANGTFLYGLNGASTSRLSADVIKHLCSSSGATRKADIIVYKNPHTTHGEVAVAGSIPFYRNGTPTGYAVVSSLLTRDKYLDGLKSMFSDEITIFGENVRYGTTLMKDGKRLIGTTLDNKAILDSVYGKKTAYRGNIALFGQSYIADYIPLCNAEGSAVGMLFVAKPLTVISQMSRLLLSRIIPVFIIMSLILIADCLIILNTQVMNPIRQVSAAMATLAAGDADLTRRIALNTNAIEFLKLTEDVNAFITSQHIIIKEMTSVQQKLESIGENLGTNSQESASAISQIMANINSVAQQVDKQTAALSSVNDLLVRTNGEIETLDRLVTQQSSDVTESSASIEEMIGNINAVTVSVQKMSDEFKNLIATTNEGSAIQQAAGVKVTEMEKQAALLIDANTIIASIAAQTNLLAMNAAIEAAHAGDAGAGFSVVADEIRKLAETSSAQSQTISKELKNISSTIKQVVSASQDSETAFKSVCTKIEQTDILVSEIDNAMTEQKEASAQILIALKDMNSSSCDVQNTAHGMTAVISDVMNEMKGLTTIADTVECSMQEMSGGATQINTSAHVISDMALNTHDMIVNMDSLIGKFKI